MSNNYKGFFNIDYTTTYLDTREQGILRGLEQRAFGGDREHTLNNARVSFILFIAPGLVEKETNLAHEVDFLPLINDNLKGKHGSTTIYSHFVNPQTIAGWEIIVRRVGYDNFCRACKWQDIPTDLTASKYLEMQSSKQGITACIMAVYESPEGTSNVMACIKILEALRDSLGKEKHSLPYLCGKPRVTMGSTEYRMFYDLKYIVEFIGGGYVSRKMIEVYEVYKDNSVALADAIKKQMGIEINSQLKGGEQQ